MLLKRMEAGIAIEVHHHEVGTAGQTEIDMKYKTLTRMADQVLKYKYIVKNVCAANGFVANFMPKPLFQDNGSGMHVHQSLWKTGKPLFYEQGTYAPGSLEEVLSALEADHDFLLKGDVFTDDVIQTWVDYKREREIDPVRLRPHPWEFYLYSDI